MARIEIQKKKKVLNTLYNIPVHKPKDMFSLPITFEILTKIKIWNPFIKKKYEKVHHYLQIRLNYT